MTRARSILFAAATLLTACGAFLGLDEPEAPLTPADAEAGSEGSIEASSNETAVPSDACATCPVLIASIGLYVQRIIEDGDFLYVIRGRAVGDVLRGSIEDARGVCRSG